VFVDEPHEFEWMRAPALYAHGNKSVVMSAGIYSEPLESPMSENAILAAYAIPLNGAAKLTEAVLDDCTCPTIEPTTCVPCPAT